MKKDHHDFIMKLLKLRSLTMEIFYNLIMVVMDELIKYNPLILLKEIFDTK